MHISAINNTNFRGLFKDNSRNNHGNWLMEYSPYSWEMKDENKFGMAPQQEWDVYASELPDNEKHYIKNNFKKSCRDILGTEFYYENLTNDEMRSHITEKPAMNREESLRVSTSKLSRLVELKDDAMKVHVIDSRRIPNILQSSKDTYNRYSADVQSGFFVRDFPKEVSYAHMDEEFSTTHQIADQMYEKFLAYVRLAKSKDEVKAKIDANNKEIKLLSEAKSEGKLIDISRRYIFDPNGALWEALQNVGEAMGKWVALPHKTISVEAILKNINVSEHSEGVAMKVIKYIDQLISKRI